MFDKKWGPVLDSFIPIKNSTIRKMCCRYLEWLESTNGDLPNSILELKIKLFELTQYKKIIKHECINLLTGRKEYLLEDGTFYDPEYINTHITAEDMVKLFGIEFLTTLDISLAREFKIENLLKNGNNN